MKIAKIMIGDPNDRKGLFVNSLDRVKALIAQEENIVDCYLIRYYYGSLVSFLKKKSIVKDFCENLEIDKIKFKIIWVKVDIISYFLNVKFKLDIVYGKNILKYYSNQLSGYDVISCHGLESIYLGLKAKNKFGVAVVSNWHGSDINIVPFKSNFAKNKIAKMILRSDHNFFVSRKLMDTSDDIIETENKSVLYTGPSLSFFKYSNEEKLKARGEISIQTKYVVGYIGNLIEIKNVLVLPEIFYKIQNKLSNQVSFIVVGDGSLAEKFKKLCIDFNLSNVFFLGKKDPEVMPSIMNSLDLLLLPSLNEGLPLVTMEAYNCGINVVGSKSGGIPEVIGDENSFNLDKNFIENVSERAVFLLNNLNFSPTLDPKFSWEVAIKEERRVHLNVCSKN